MKIAVFSSREYDEKYLTQENVYNYELTFFSESLNIKNVSKTKGFDAICAFVNDDLNGDVISKLNENNIKVISMRCSGINNVDLKTAAKNKIHVSNVKRYSPHSVAELAMGLILSLNRHIHRAYVRVRNLNFSIDGFLGFDLFEKTVGIIGMGKIGLTLSEILKGFGCNILAYDPRIERQNENRISYVDLPTLYKNSDIISLHCPLNDDTHHMINEKSLGLMKKGVMLINTGRGGLVDTNSIIEGLKSSKIGYLGLDVYEEEENIFFQNLSEDIFKDDTFARLLTFPNVLITAHQGFFTKEAVTNIARVALKNINDFENDNFENDLIKE